MSDLKMLSDMMDLADKGGTLPPDWYDNYLKALREPWVNAVDSRRKRKECLDFFDCEAYGNPCPICSSKPEPYGKDIKFGKRVIGSMESYRMICDCESNLEKNIREEKELNQRMVLADIPESYNDISWASWDPTVDKELTIAFRNVQELSTPYGMNNVIGKGLLLFGDVGRGKTMTAFCLLKSILRETKLNCKYIPMADFTDRVINSGQDGSYLDQIGKYDVLFLDDLDKLSATSAWVQERIFSLFDKMFRENKTLIITTNIKTIPLLEKHFKDHGEAIVSRMVDKMRFAKFFGGDDYRKKRRMEQNKNNSN